MKLSRILLSVVLLSMVFAVSTLRADNDPCEKGINCDCGSIDAGLLTRPWRDDCNACEKRLEAACREVYAYEQAYRALTIGGYCENKCSVTGDNPWPRPEAALPPADAPAGAPPTIGEATLSCPMETTLVVESLDDGYAKGCKNAAGQWDGVVMFFNAAGELLAEAFWSNGAQAWRRDAAN